MNATECQKTVESLQDELMKTHQGIEYLSIVTALFSNAIGDLSEGIVGVELDNFLDKHFDALKIIIKNKTRLH